MLAKEFGRAIWVEGTGYTGHIEELIFLAIAQVMREG